jgi:hypothetical protein
MDSVMTLAQLAPIILLVASLTLGIVYAARPQRRQCRGTACAARPRGSRSLLTRAEQKPLAQASYFRTRPYQGPSATPRASALDASEPARNWRAPRAALAVRDAVATAARSGVAGLPPGCAAAPKPRYSDPGGRTPLLASPQA